MEGKKLFFFFFHNDFSWGEVKVFQKSNIFNWISRPIFPSQVYYYCYCGLALVLINHTSVTYFKPTTSTYNISMCFK